MKTIKLIITIIFFIISLQTSSLGDEKNNQVNKISKNLRCLICDGQSIYDSQSDFALSVKILIENHLESGKSEKEIYNFLKDKYGEWIVYNPEINKNTILLWSIPLILFVFGGILIFRKVSINKVNY